MDISSSPIQPGNIVAGKFRIERVIGTGGVGVVVAARHLGLGQMVALKFLVSGARRDPTDVARFVREAQSAVKLKNEHVARVIDVDTLPDGSPFMVMEYLEGRDVEERLRSDGPLPVLDAVGVTLQVCEAVAEAHSLSIIHRDLKPSNFFLTTHRDGSTLVKVLDFGIAKARAELQEQGLSLTQTRTLLGSPVYMSPEHVRSARSVDPRSDIWSLGVSLFEMLTGTVPFAGDTVTGVAVAVTTDPTPPIASLRNDVPKGLVATIERCLAKNPENRYQSVAELAEALLPFGPSDGAAMLQRIRGTLGVLGSRDVPTPRGLENVQAAGTMATTLLGHNTTLRQETTRPHRSVGLLALLALVALGVGVLTIDRVSSQSGIGSSPATPSHPGALPHNDAVSGENARSSASLPAAPAPSAPRAADSAFPAAQPPLSEASGLALPSSSVVPLAGTAAPDASGRLPFPQRRARALRSTPRGESVLRPAPPASAAIGATPTHGRGGTIDDMVDTRR